MPVRKIERVMHAPDLASRGELSVLIDHPPRLGHSPPPVGGQYSIIGLDSIDNIPKSSLKGGACTMSPNVTEGLSQQRLLDVLIRAGMISVLAIFSYQVFHPFLNLMMWSLILAITLYPLHTM